MPALRFITDFGQAGDEQTSWLIPLGQSGHAASAHYADLVARWEGDARIPLAWTSETERATTVDRLTLTPAATAKGGAA